MSLPILTAILFASPFVSSIAQAPGTSPVANNILNQKNLLNNNNAQTSTSNVKIAGVSDGGDGGNNPTVQNTPEPATLLLALLGSGTAAVWGLARRRRLSGVPRD
jgi:hypothetical protein